MANKKRATKSGTRIAGERAGTKGLVNDFLSPEDLGHKHQGGEGRLVHADRRHNERTPGAA